MATGTVVGPPIYRDIWIPTPATPDETWTSQLTTENPLATMNIPGHHRSYSDAPNGLTSLRLPPISNLIEGAERPNAPHRPSFHTAQPTSPFRPGLPSQPPPIARRESNQWSPTNHPRVPYQSDHPQRYDARQNSEPFYSWNIYRRSSVAVPPASSSEVRRDSSHAPHQVFSDPMSPDAPATAKNVVREDIIPGKGPCFVYDDGSVCPKYVNGDTVNPKWGTTKAGKPRKRLGQACNTCREKKIKCDPSYPKCTQCQKFGRECRFEAPSRAGNKSPRIRPGDSPTSTYINEDSERMRRHSAALTDTSSHSEAGTVSSRAAGIVEDNLSPSSTDSIFTSDAPGPSKKARLIHLEPDTMARLQMASQDRQSSFALDTDPFDVDRKLTETYLDAYFTHVNGSMFSLTPQRFFLDWARHTRDKPQVSKLVLYCMLAVGCGFSKSADSLIHARIFESIALEGVKQSFGYFSVQLIQARLIFALHEFRNGREDKAWDLSGSALRTAAAMNLNTEDGIAQQLRERIPVYGLDPARLAECMRRTFWVAYTMDNLGVACLSLRTTFSKAGCSLQLPCSRRAYEEGIIPKTPVFDGEILPVRPSEAALQDNVGTLGYLMQIASLCCDVRALAFKASHRTSYVRNKRYTAAREDLENQLRLWHEQYTVHINLRHKQRTPMQTEYPFSFGGLHLMYHYACMQLHRHIPHSSLPRNAISEHAQAAYLHAEKTLSIAQQLMSRRSQDIFHYSFAASSPFSGYAIHYAIDILSAGGINAKLLENQSPIMDLIINSVQLLDNLAEVWSSARVQQKQVSDRISLVTNAARVGNAEGKVGFCMEEPMVTWMSKEQDLVYGTDRMLYLKSFGWAERIQNPSDLDIVSNKGKRNSCSVWQD